MIVIDASVYVALLKVDEAASERSWQWFQSVQLSGEVVVAPAILLPEIAAAIGRGVGNPERAREAVANLRHSTLITLLPITSRLAERSATIAGDHQIRGCDAIYVALAEQEDATLVTFDQQQLLWGAAVVQTREP
jgi:predicted nucleic acid-binding protein